MSFIIVGLLLLLSIVYSQTNIHSNGFELDGDTEVIGTSTTTSDGYPKDWVYFNTAYTLPINSWSSGIIVDPGTTTTFEQSAKDTKDISLWLWGPDNNAQAKTDIYHIMSYAKKTLNSFSIYFGADRVGGSGISANSAFGYWFVQDPLFGLNGINSGSFSGTHFPGDLLITSNFANPPYIELFKWDGFGINGSLKSLGTISQKCNSSISQTICAIFNNAPTPTSINFPYNNNIYPETTFMEGGININSWLNITDGNIPCYSKILSMTRTSSSTSATLKDFGLGDFELCQTLAESICNENTVEINKLNNGTIIFTYYYTLNIDQTGVGNIYDIQVTIPDGFNDLGNNAILYLDQVLANTQQTLTYYFTRTNLNNIIIPDIYISYCFFDNCAPPYRRIVTAQQLLCIKPTPSPTNVPSFTPSKIPTNIPSPSPTRSPSKNPTFVPSKIPTYNPTKLPTKIPTYLPTASPITTNLLLNTYCNITINEDYCYDFKWSWYICNYGDRNVYNITITSQKDLLYKYIIPLLTINECKLYNNIIYEPIRYSNNDPILNNNIWNDQISIIGYMIIGGIKTISVTSSSSFTCNLCL